MNLKIHDEFKRFALGLGAGCAFLLLMGAVIVTKIRDYPQVTTPATNDLFVLEAGTGLTNKNIKYSDLKNSITTSITNQIASITNTLATLTNDVSGKVAKAGDTMTGALTLSGAPTTGLHATTKTYVDAGDASTYSAAQLYASAQDLAKVDKAGDTMTGLLLLSDDPVANLGAVTKQYADTHAPTFITNITLVTSNVYATNIYVSGSSELDHAQFTNYLRTLFHDFTGSTNINANLSSFQGATLSASTAFSLVNSTNGTRILVRFVENGTGGFTPTIDNVNWVTSPSNWNTNAGGISYVTISDTGGGTADALLVGTNSTAVGVDNLWTNDSGLYPVGSTINLGLGLGALASITSGSFNTALGYAVLGLSEDGYQNTAIGFDAAAATTTGVDNVAVGYNAMLVNVGGGENVAVGSLALQTGVSGHQNVALGFNADVDSAALTNVVAIGHNARGTNDNDFVLGGPLHNHVIRGLRYSWPASHSYGRLVNDGFGGLTWSSAEILNSVTWGATTTFGFTSPVVNYRLLTLAGNTTFVTTNLASGLWFSCFITGAATNCAMSFPGWHFMNQVAPTSLAAGKVASLTVFFYGNTDGAGVANYSVEP